MKKILLLISVLFFFSCGKDEVVKNEEYSLYGKNEGGLHFSSYKEKKLNSGEIIEEKISTIVHIWDATNKDFNVKKSKSDILNGFLYDNISKKSVKPVATFMYKESFFETFKKGKYFIYVTTDGDTQPKFAYSYKYFEVKENEDVKLKKVYKLNTKWLEANPW